MNNIRVNGTPQRKVYMGLFMAYLTGVFCVIIFMVFRVTNCMYSVKHREMLYFGL